MQTSLIRTQFLDRPLRQNDVSAIALLLADWFNQKYHRHATVQITMTLWGFAQKQGEVLTQNAQKIAAAQNLPFASVALSGADFLVVQGAPVSTKNESGNDADVVLTAQTSACLQLLEAGPFENLWCEIALSVHSGDRQNKQYARRLTLMGVVGQNQFVLKAVWPEGSGEFNADLYKSAPWPLETNFLQSLAAYQSGDRILPKWGHEHLFFESEGLFVRKAVVWFLRPLHKGWQAIFGRIALSGLIAFACGTDLFIYGLRARHIILIVGFMAIALLGFGFHVFMSVGAIMRTRSAMRANYEKLYAGHTAHLPVYLEDAPPSVQNDPALRKLSQDVEDMGGVHYKDVTIEPPIAGRFFIRLFLFPDQATLFALSFMVDTGTFRVFPAKPVFLLRTNFADGFRLVTVNSGAGFRKNRLPHVICRRFMNVTEPGEMLQKHLKVLQRAEAEGHVRLPLEPDTILEQMDNETRENGDVSKKYGHFHWDDAFRMVFDLPRREYAEDA